VPTSAPTRQSRMFWTDRTTEKPSRRWSKSSATLPVSPPEDQDVERSRDNPVGAIRQAGCGIGADRGSDGAFENLGEDGNADPEQIGEDQEQRRRQTERRDQKFSGSQVGCRATGDEHGERPDDDQPELRGRDDAEVAAPDEQPE